MCGGGGGGGGGGLTEHNSDRTEHRDEVGKTATMETYNFAKSSILEMIAFIKVHLGKQQVWNTTGLEHSWPLSATVLFHNAFTVRFYVCMSWSSITSGH